MRSITAVVCALMLSVSSVAAEPDVAVRNVRAFAKLYGYIRWFHPSDEAAGIDWDRFAIHGAQTVSAAKTPAELRAALEALFAPLAPSVQLFGDGETPKAVQAAAGDDLQVVAWQHLGAGLGSPGMYRSARLNRKSAGAAPDFGGILQEVDATPLRGKQVRLSARGKAAVAGTGNQLQFWMRVDRPNRAPGFFENMDSRPIRTNVWGTYEIAGEVADDAQRITFGAFLAGEGRAWVDAFHLEARERGGNWTEVTIRNPGFEADLEGTMPVGWAGGGGGFVAGVRAEDPGEGLRSVRIERDAPSSGGGALFEAHPKAGESVDALLTEGLHARIPLALHSRNGQTLPRADAAALAALQKALVAVDPGAATDRNVRLGGVVIAWNVFQHFYPYFDVVKTDWDAVLTQGIRRALADTTPRQFRETLRWMVAELHDGHGSVSTLRPDPEMAWLPFVVEWVEGKAVVVATASDAFRIGDVVLSIDGEAAGAVLERLAASRSGSPQWKRVMAGREFTLGERGSIAKLVVDRAGERLTLDAPRATREYLQIPRPANFTEVRPGVMYVDLGSAEMTEIDAQAEKLAAARAIVFDLRGYPGGNHQVLGYLTKEPVRSARWQVPQAIYPDRQRLAGYDEAGRWTLPPKTPRFGGEIVFLTGSGSISYAESVMGIVEHYKLGTIVGGRTAGANGNVNSFQLPGGFRVNFTGMRVLKHDGSQHHLVGIAPDVPVERTVAGVRAGRDEVLEKALEVIDGKNRHPSK